jgi:hypothetical protein
MLSLIPARSPLPSGAALPTNWFDSSIAAERNMIPTPAADIAMGASTNAMSWCSITKTKIALIYIALNAGVNKYYVQIVNFVNKVPVYSAPNFIVAAKTGSSMQHPLMRITKIAENRLVASLPENMPKLGLAAAHTFSLLQINADDTVTLLSRTAAQTTSATGRNLVPQLPLLFSEADGSAWYSGSSVGSQGGDYTRAYPRLFKLTMTGDVLSFTAGRGNSTYQSDYLYPTYWGHRKDRLGKEWSVSDSNGAFALWNASGINDSADSFNGLFLSGWYTYPRTLVPVDGDKFIYFSGTSVTTAQFKRRTGTSSTGTIEAITTLTTTPLPSDINFSSLTVEDAVWVDATTFVMIAGLGTSPGTISNFVINNSDTLAEMSTDLRVLVFRYDEITNKVTLSSNTNLLDLSLSKRIYDSMLHQVDQDTMAVIGTFAPKGTADTTHQILMLKSGASA